MSEEVLADRLGKGALESPEDIRDLHLSFIAGAVTPIDWSKPFRLPEPPDSNQAKADCCVAESSSYFHWMLTRKQFSVRSVFAYIAFPNGYGAFLRDGPLRIVKYGQETLHEAPDPSPKTAQNMRSKVGLNPANALDDRELRFFDTGGNAEQLAQAVRDWGGAIFGLSMTGLGWQDLTNPRPPQPNEGGEGHALYAFGYHMHDGMKCIIAKSSWCGAQPGHHEHHIKEDYFASGYVYPQAFVIVPKERIPMVRRYKVNDNGTLGVMLITDGSFDATFYRAKNQEHYDFLLKFYEVPANAPVVNIPLA